MLAGRSRAFTLPLDQDRYGAAELDVAVRKALGRGVPHPNAVRLGSADVASSRNAPPQMPSTCLTMSRSENQGETERTARPQTQES